MWAVERTDAVGASLHTYTPPAPLPMAAGAWLTFNGFSDELAGVAAMLHVTILRSP